MAEAVLRWTIRIGADWTIAYFAGDIVHVAARNDDTVEFWTLAQRGGETAFRRLRVFGTGHLISAKRYAHRGTAFTDDGALAWHLIEDISAEGDDD